MTDQEWLDAKDQIVEVLKAASVVFDPYDTDPDLDGFTTYNRYLWLELPVEIRDEVEPEWWVEAGYCGKETKKTPTQT